MSKDVLSQQIIILSRSFDRGSMNQEPPKIDLESSKLLLPLEEAATALSLTPRQLSRLAGLRDIGHLTLDGGALFSNRGAPGVGGAQFKEGLVACLPTKTAAPR